MLPEGSTTLEQLNTTHDFYSNIHLHDSHYFAMNKNPLTIPRKKLKNLNELETSILIYLAVSKIIQMNTMDNVCEENQDEINFISCLELYHIKVRIKILRAHNLQ